MRLSMQTGSFLRITVPALDANSSASIRSVIPRIRRSHRLSSHKIMSSEHNAHASFTDSSEFGISKAQPTRWLAERSRQFGNI